MARTGNALATTNDPSDSFGYEDGEFGYEDGGNTSSASAPITPASSSAATTAQHRTELIPTSVADQIASSVGGLAAEAANQASAAFTSQAQMLLPRLARHHQENLGGLAAAIVDIYSRPPGGTAFSEAFQRGLDSAGLAQHSFGLPEAPDFMKIANEAVDQV